MRILVHDYSGHPFQVQLSRALAGRGHRVLHLHFADFQTPKGALAPREDDPEGLAIEGLSLGRPFRKQDFLRRRGQEKAYGRILARRAASWRPEVALSANTPLDALAALQGECRASGVRFVFWVQDLIGIAIRRLLRRRLPVVGQLAGRYYEALEARIARRSDALVLITEDFRPVMRGWGVPADRLHVIENWAPLDGLPPRPRRNPWAEAHGLGEGLCLLYAGTLGLKHNPALLLRLAERFRDRPDVSVVVVSEGAGADWLAERKAERGLDRLVLLGFQPFERLAEVLATGDVLLAILEPDAGIFSVPSKVLSCLAAGRPILGALPAENLAARIVLREGAGMVVDPGDPEGFAAAAERLLADAGLRRRMGESGRAYAEKAFDIDSITDRFENLLAGPRPN